MVIFWRKTRDFPEIYDFWMTISLRLLGIRGRAAPESNVLASDVTVRKESAFNKHFFKNKNKTAPKIKSEFSSFEKIAFFLILKMQNLSFFENRKLSNIRRNHNVVFFWGGLEILWFPDCIFIGDAFTNWLYFILICTEHSLRPARSRGSI